MSSGATKPTSALQQARFSRESELIARMNADDLLKREFARTDVLRQRSMARARLLSQAVRLNVKVLPNVAGSFLRLQRHFQGGKELEAYVFAEPEINAFVTEGRHYMLVGVSSGAVQALSSEELEFVIGHELGHALFGHLDIPVEFLLHQGNLDLERCQLLRSFQRSAEISADRAGLLCCGSIEVAANAIFKTVSGLNIPGQKVEPAELAAQWDHLVEEVLEDGRREHWQLSHPFPPLRMRALLAFHEKPLDAADAEVRRLLALMEGSVSHHGEAEDPFLVRFLFWGGLYVALADGEVSAEERAHFLQLSQRTPTGVDIEIPQRSSPAAAELCLERFREARRSRRQKLNASELHRMTRELLGAAKKNGSVSEARLGRLRKLCEELGVAAAAVDMMMIAK